MCGNKANRIALTFEFYSVCFIANTFSYTEKAERPFSLN